MKWSHFCTFLAGVLFVLACTELWNHGEGWFPLVFVFLLAAGFGIGMAKDDF